MEVKKTPQADMEQRRTTGFLLGLVLVLSCCYVALEWNSVPAANDFDALDLSELTHESELVPMSNVETVTQLREQQHVQGEQLRVVDDDVETEPADEVDLGEDGDDDSLLADLQDGEDDKALAPLAVDPLNPLNFHMVQAVFYVEKDGSITGLKVVKSLSPECDKEALRVLSMMPKWQPGIQHDQPCRTKVCIPIVFKL